MAGINLRKACLDSFSQLAGDDVKDALVYMDAGAGEAFHFLGGLSALLPFGPRAVCSLENAAPLDAEVRLCSVANDAVEKVLVITTHLLSYVHQYIHHCLEAHSSLKLLTVLTSVSEEAHAAHPDSCLGTDAFHEYKRWLMEDYQLVLQRANADHTDDTGGEDFAKAKVHEMHEKTLESSDRVDFTDADSQVKAEVEEDLEDPGATFSVNIRHFPMIVCPLTKRAFVLPSDGILARSPLAEADSSLGIGLPYTDSTSNKHDDDVMPIGGTLIAHFFHHLAGQLSLKFDVYTLGPLSNEVGKHLTQLSGLADVSVRSRRPAGLLIIDRTLDLITPSSHSDSLMDRLFALSSRRNKEYNSKMLTANRNTVIRPALDMRIPSARDDPQEFWMPGLQNKDLLEFISNYELGEGLIKLNAQKVSGGSNSSNATIPMLRSLGSSFFDLIAKQEHEHLDSLLEKRVNDSLIAIEKWLKEAISAGNYEAIRGVTNAKNIQSLCNTLSQNVLSALEHAHLIQVSKAVDMATDPALSSKWDVLLNAEKVLSMSINDSSQSAASQICDIVHQSIERGNRKIQTLALSQTRRLLTLRDALTLAIVGYALAGYSFGRAFSEGPFLRDEEEKLKQAVVDAILQGSGEDLGFLQGLEDSLALHQQQNPSETSAVSESSGTEAVMKKVTQEAQLDFNIEGWEAWDDEDEMDTDKGEPDDGNYRKIQLQLQVRDRVEAVFGRLHRVSESGQFLRAKAKASVFEEYDGLGGSSSTRRSLIFKLLMLIFGKAEIPGLEHHASFVGRILKSGLGRFGLRQVKPKLSDHKIIMVFVIGGINGVEVCEAKEAQTIYKMEDEIDVLLGGTSFVTPDDIFDLLIGSSTYS